MNAPKILPWIARRAGISEALGLKLWRRAAGEAECLSGQCSGPDYHRLAIEGFLRLVEGESTSAQPIDPASTPVGWLWQHQHRISHLGLIAAQQTCRLWQAQWKAHWQQFADRQRAAFQRAA